MSRYTSCFRLFTHLLYLFSALAFAAIPSVSLMAQRTWVVDQGHKRAADSNPGTHSRPFRTISPAAAAAMPGDTVLVKAGIYRERVAPARGGAPDKPIVYQAFPGHRVSIKASEPWQPQWRPEPGAPGVWFGAFDPSRFVLRPAPPKAEFPDSPA